MQCEQFEHMFLMVYMQGGSCPGRECNGFNDSLEGSIYCAAATFAVVRRVYGMGQCRNVSPFKSTQPESVGVERVTC